MRFKNKVAVVTGGSRGIGAAIARQLRSEGARVYTPTRKELNVASDEAWESFEIGAPVDIMVNCAGVADGNVATNLFGVDRGIEWAVARMANGRGAIVNITSIFGQRAGSGKAGMYQATKAGVAALTRAAAVRYADFGIRVNAVAPGFIDTDMTADFHTNPKYRDFVMQGTPMKRMGYAKEVAAAVAFLASDEASYITGIELPVDGGWLAR